MPESYLDPASAIEEDPVNGRAQEKAITLCPSRGKLWIVRRNTRWVV